MKAAVGDAIVDEEKEWAPPRSLANCENVVVIRILFPLALQKGIQQREGTKVGSCLRRMCASLSPGFFLRRTGERVARVAGARALEQF